MKKLKASRFPEYFALLLFAAAYIVITVFHEPWFDEAQAWQIAKCASLKEILFELPHYEGHPPLWHLILAVPAKLGVPYEIGLKTVGFLFAAAVAYIILFKSPFPRILRLLLPFNYFIFYQYGVIVRPYGMMMLLMLLLAVVFPVRNEKPWRFGAVGMLLCASHSYGLLIAGGIAICYLLDMFREKGARRFFREFFRDKRIGMLVCLLLLALLIIAEIFPREDTYAASKEAKNPFFLCLLCTVFSMLPDCFLSYMNWTGASLVTVQEAEISTANLMAVIIVGAALWFLIFCCSSKKSFQYFAVPYLLFAIFAAAVYFRAQHEGICLGIVMFWLWITFEDKDRFAFWKVFRSKMSERDAKLVSRAASVLILLCLLFPIYWTAAASVNDIKAEYSYGRGAAKFLKDTGLDKALIFKAWTMPNEDNAGSNMFCSADPTVLAYFDRNLFANISGGDARKAYTGHHNRTEEQIAQQFESWRKLGLPDVLFGYAELSDVYGEDASTHGNYSPVYLAHEGNIYKDNSYDRYLLLLLRNDLLDDYDVEVQNVPEYFIGIPRISEETSAQEKENAVR